MVSFPNCKINLGLNIISKRADGYHNLETIFYPVPFTDALEVIHADKNITQKDVEFSSSGLNVDGDAANNLCIKAYHLLKKDFPQLPAIKMHLHKAIPMGAGLGGGSSDAAFTLALLNNKFHLNLTTAQLINYSLQLGSDCPFFIINKPCLATGRGEVLEEIQVDLPGYKLVIINPGIHISTGWAFEQITPAKSLISIKEIIRQPVEVWKEKLVNDFEKPVLGHYPELQQLKDSLYKSGAVYAAMSGSGSSFYGIFKTASVIDQAQFPSKYFIKSFEG
ncbi:4-(cytidine 5'-diphospho)-2-C-methyl-D-erythritol kinase [soil metagenome]